jgi:hypothetical protein
MSVSSPLGGLDGQIVSGNIHRSKAQVQQQISVRLQKPDLQIGRPDVKVASGGLTLLPLKKHERESKGSIRTVPM